VQFVGRDLKNVRADVQTLARSGLVSLTATRVGRRTTVPRLPFSVLEFRIAVWGGCGTTARIRLNWRDRGVRDHDTPGKSPPASR
jgi:predicted transcriptional regulator